MPSPQPEVTPYLPSPKLVKGHVWYIEFYSFDANGLKKRERKTFDLNRIKNIQEREARATRIISELDRQMLKNSSVELNDLEKSRTPMIEALKFACQIKCNTDREHTRITYNSMTNIFCRWLTEKGWGEHPVGAFSKPMALKFMDHVQTERRTRDGAPLGHKAYNNYIQNLRALFTELLERGFVFENPFSGIKPKKEQQKIRIAFEQGDADAIAKYAWEHDRLIYFAITLISHCGIRLAELRRLRFRDIDVERGVVAMSGAQTKNHENAFITIPSHALPVIGHFLKNAPMKALIFGQNLEPHLSICCGRNSISDRFRFMLDEMILQGKLSGRQGYSAYSWKDTGAIIMVKAGLDILAIQKHLRHKSLAVTQKYLQSLGLINKDVRDFKGTIFQLPEEFGAAT